MRLDNTISKRLALNPRLVIMGLIFVTLLLLPSLGSIKVFLIHKGYVATHKGQEQKALDLIKGVISAPMRYFTATHPLPFIKLDIKYEDWLLLSEDRQQGLSDGKISDARRQVTAQLSHDGKTYKAKVRLQGDMVDHINHSERWSLRLALKHKQALFGARRFSLVSPHVRIHQGPVLFAHTMKVAGFDIVSPQHIPVRIAVNGVDWGVMLFEQAFSQSLLATNNRTEGVITRLAQADEYLNQAGENVKVLRPRVLQASTVLANPSLQKQRMIALHLLGDFLSGKRAASDVFDAKKLGQYLATVDVWGAWHALTWNNWRWYYNPHTALLEPIQSDVAVTPAEHIWLMQAPSLSLVISRQMRADPNVETQYQQALAQLHALIQDTSLYQALEAKEAHYLAQLDASAPLTPEFDFSVLSRQLQCLIQGYAQPPCRFYPTLSQALHKPVHHVTIEPNWDLASQFSGSPEEGKLTLVNPSTRVLTVQGLVGTTHFGDIDLLDEINGQFPLSISPHSKLTLALPTTLASVEIRGGYESQKAASYPVFKNIPPDAFLPRPGKEDNVLNAYPFIREENGRWHINPGVWEIHDYLKTPPDWEVVIAPGTELRFAQQAGLMVFGQLVTRGVPQSQVRLKPIDENQGWFGLAVFGSEKKHDTRLSHTQIVGASSPRHGIWHPRGAAYLVNSDIRASHFGITRNQSEDALNIIASHIALRALTISHTLSDAFDCDFCSGSVSNSVFKDIGYRSGGDGIDVSGSQLSISETRFSQIRDKAISGGEQSHLRLSHIHIDNASFGIVAKDNTRIDAAHAFMQEITHNALMSYSKKPIFGPAQLRVREFSCKEGQCNKQLVAETDSLLVVNGRALASQSLDVKQLYRTVMKSDKPQ